MKETEYNLKLVDRPLCNYFSTYEIDAPYIFIFYIFKDLSILFDDENPSQ